MPIPREHLQERLSYAYVEAVVARAGAALAVPHDYGDDGHIQLINRLPNGKYCNTGYLFHCQIKASTTTTIQNDVIAYEMEVEAYNKLASWEGHAPILLLLLRLPDRYEDWISISEERMILQQCCYWYHNLGPCTENTSTKTIHVPRTQIFTPESVTDWLERVKRGNY